MIQYGKELLRISPKDARKIEYSTNNGSTWNKRYTDSGTRCGSFISLMDGGKELLAQTANGVFYSNNKGVTWNRRSR